MKLNSRQVIGLAAIVVFGGGMIFRLTQPSEREVMEQRLASLPRVSDSIRMPDMPPIEIPSLTGPTAPESVLNGGGATTTDNRPIWQITGVDYYNIGSQAAKDDLYCGGVLSAEFEAIIATAHPDKSSMVLRDSQALDESGIARLKAEGAIDGEAWAGFTLAYEDKAKTDIAAGAPRISVADCTARAAALN